MSSHDPVADIQKEAARVAARASIRDVRLVGASMRMDRFPAANPRLTYNLGYEPELEFSDGEDVFVVHIKFDVNITEVTEDSDEQQPVASIKFEHAALFELEMREGDDPVKVEELSAYASTTGLFALYPYAREFIYDATGRLALPPLTVDVLRLPVNR